MITLQNSKNPKQALKISKTKYTIFFFIILKSVEWFRIIFETPFLKSVGETRRHYVADYRFIHIDNVK